MKAQDCRDIVYIEWLDSSGIDSWSPIQDLEDGQLAKCRTAGILLFEDDEAITVALSVDDQHDNVLNALTIPRASITHRSAINDLEEED